MNCPGQLFCPDDDIMWQWRLSHRKCMSYACSHQEDNFWQRMDFILLSPQQQISKKVCVHCSHNQHVASDANFHWHWLSARCHQPKIGLEIGGIFIFWKTQTSNRLINSNGQTNCICREWPCMLLMVAQCPSLLGHLAALLQLYSIIADG